MAKKMHVDCRGLFDDPNTNGIEADPKRKMTTLTTTPARRGGLQGAWLLRIWSSRPSWAKTPNCSPGFWASTCRRVRRLPT